MANSLSTQIEGFTGLPVNKQISLMILIAAASAMVAVVVIWMRTPAWQTLVAPQSPRESAQVVDLLTKSSIPYRVEKGSGALQVDANQLNQARLVLAGAGVLPGEQGGFESLGEQALGTSQFMERARYQNAVEGELARTISSMAGIASARVHLALPKESPFLRKSRGASASVLVHLLPGRTLSDETTAAIVHLVSSSVPGLQPDVVSVVDQTGRLHSASLGARSLESSRSQLEYKQKIEQLLAHRIESIVSPITGPDGVRAEVTAEFDFDRVEQTEERFDPQRSAVRSEQRESTREAAASLVGGVPGALSNEPPQALVDDSGDTGPAQQPPRKEMLSDHSVTNYEVDRQISHRRHASGKIHRLSIAVLVNQDGFQEPISEEQMALISSLVKQASGFNETRGDQISVTKASFQAPPEIVTPEIPIWERGWVPGVIRHSVGGLMLLLIFFFLIRPMMRNLGNLQALPVPARLPGAAGGDGTREEEPADQPRPLSLPDMQRQESRLEFARQVAGSDPKKVSQVVKGWMAGDA